MRELKIIKAIASVLTKLKCRCKSSCCSSECVNNPSPPLQSEGGQDVRKFAYKITKEESL
jgi:hypothetical protein